jgi:hypothetical protein
MAEDWASIAYSLIPAAIGAGLGGAGGGLYGFSKGVSDAAESRMATDRYNKQIEFRNIDDARQQAALEQQAQQHAAEQERWVQLNKRAEVQSTHLEAQTKLINDQLKDAEATDLGQLRMRATMKPDDQALFDAAEGRQGKNAFLQNYGKRQIAEQARPGLIETLKYLGHPAAESYGKYAELDDLGKMIGQWTNISEGHKTEC